MQGEWLFLMDDDHRFDDDLVMKLLDHDLDVVTAITTKKFPPYAPVLYKDDKEPIDLTGKSGLVEVYACGKPGMLIRRHVLEDIPDPWCEYQDSEMGAEDFDLCAKIRKAGYTIHADLDIPLGHMAPYTAYKTKDNNGN